MDVDWRIQLPSHYPSLLFLETSSLKHLRKIPDVCTEHSRVPEKTLHCPWLAIVYIYPASPCYLSNARYTIYLVLQRQKDSSYDFLFRQLIRKPGGFPCRCYCPLFFFCYLIPEYTCHSVWYFRQDVVVIDPSLRLSVSYFSLLFHVFMIALCL